jgi:hypothetical protein
MWLSINAVSLKIGVKNMSHKKKAKKKSGKPYTQGQLNLLIDAVVHPFYKQNEGLRVLDGLLHGLVERNPPVSVRKFVKYNLPEIIKKITKNRR